MVVEPILQIEDSVQNGLFAQSIFGLNVFAANSVPREAEPDPRCLFLENLARHHASSAHIGTLAFEGDSPTDFFGSTKPSCLEARVGIYGSTFYSSDTEPIGCFFPEAHALYQGRQAKNLRYLLSCDALSLYVDPGESADSRIRDLLNKTVDSSEQWLHYITGLYSVIIVSHADEWHFTALSQDAAHFQLLDTSLQQAKSAIETSLWYVQNKPHLRWNSSENTPDNCLKIG